ncbi:hypothetical protein [Kitasatospora sp. GP82]|uniref:hypothetical protein n=1 Tax=Kitasatospora sp. GP82 TaxID=3035089 RepID=UPI0024754F76|nr:hypothetical protein [Kitasatospora sp. GP82]MDH6130591.1 hypothetical protein [Kitasatospora sp. GP82]
MRVRDELLGLANLDNLLRARRPVGPVVLNHALRAVEVLIPVSRHRDWQARGTEVLTRQQGSIVPVTVRMPVPGRWLIKGRKWRIAPDGRQILTEPARLAIATYRAWT